MVNVSGWIFLTDLDQIFFSDHFLSQKILLSMLNAEIPVWSKLAPNMHS